MERENLGGFSQILKKESKKINFFFLGLCSFEVEIPYSSDPTKEGQINGDKNIPLYCLSLTQPWKSRSRQTL